MVVALAVACGGRAQKSVQIKGSDTELNLVQMMAEAYMKEHPDVSISVLGGGSGVGISALINGDADIANSSRPMKPEELEMARSRGVEPVEFVLGFDAISIIVNPQNPISQISLQDLGRLYRGEVGSWEELGGPQLPVVLYGRQSNSGTYVYFMEHVLQGEYSQDMRRMNGNAQIVEAVAQDPAGIGYVGLGYVLREDGSFDPRVKVLQVEGKLPTDSDYPIRRLLYQYTNGKPQGLVRDFIQFELSPKGQEMVRKVGFFPVAGSQLEAKNAEALGR